MLHSPVTREQLCVMLKRYHDLIYPPQLNKSKKLWKIIQEKERDSFGDTRERRQASG